MADAAPQVDPALQEGDAALPQGDAPPVEAPVARTVREMVGSVIMNADGKQEVKLTIAAAAPADGAAAPADGAGRGGRRRKSAKRANKKRRSTKKSKGGRKSKRTYKR